MATVFRCFVEKKPGFAVEADHLLEELKGTLGVESLTGLRIFRRYDVEGVEQAAYESARHTVFAEPQVDVLTDEVMPAIEGAHSLLAVEALPGQYDQRADSACQCVQMLTGGERPVVQTANVYVLEGVLSAEALARVRDYLINPVECRQAREDKPATLVQRYDAPAAVPVLEGFTALKESGLKKLLEQYGLAMDLADLKFLQDYFKQEEQREPTLTELRLVDTYWSDHCRHTTFSTHIDRADIQDPEVQKAYQLYLDAREEVYGKEKAAQRPQTLMDLATIGAKVLKKRGVLQHLDESEEINACSVKIRANVDGQEQDWLLMFKNETHNHPTEIEPFGGAATCIGGAIRDPLSGRAYVYQAMRVTGCGDPRDPVSTTLEGKLPQRKLCQTAAAGYSSYGNQIGLATGMVSEIYHKGYIAKHMECGAVVGAAPAENVVRETPAPGDRVILLGGRTGRDGIGGATGSSKTHNEQSLEKMASEVQKGNAPEERKIQRLFRDGRVTRRIKRCNDFGAGGVSVAIGELADGLDINLDAVRKKYDGLDGTELAISESQERMAVVVAPGDVEAFIAAAGAENLEAYEVAQVTEAPRMVMRWNGAVIANLSRAFLNSNGADKHISVTVPEVKRPIPSFRIPLPGAVAGNLNLCSQRGLAERFDSTIGSGSVLVPYGGAAQRTPVQAMACLLPVAPGQSTDTCSVMAWGFDPKHMELDPYCGAAGSVVDSITKLVAAGCSGENVYLSFQEYFERLRDEPLRWGKPFAALLGALEAQLSLGAAAIGGKDSMSGSFLDKDVPPTLISFAVSTAKAGDILTPEFKAPGSPVYLFAPEKQEGYEGMKKTWALVHELAQAGTIKSAWAVGPGGPVEGVIKMSLGNRIGFLQDESLKPGDLYVFASGAILAECDGAVEGGKLVGHTTQEQTVTLDGITTPIAELQRISEYPLSQVYPIRAGESAPVEPISWQGRAPMVCKSKTPRPRAVITVFPGTNCEYDTAAACEKAGIQPEIFVVKNGTADLLHQSAQALERAISGAQMMVLPGGFSGGDEPDGSAKFICSFLRNPRLTDAVHDLLQNRDGLMLGICNGFQALVKLGLVPYGQILAPSAEAPTLTYNQIGRHQSRYVTTRISSVQSPWMLKCEVGDLHTIPVSHGEGRFVATDKVLGELIAKGQVSTQYVDGAGLPNMDIDVNPNGSLACVEGIFSPDGRVFGKMGHSERYGVHLAKNIPGNKHQPLFEGGARYYK